MLARRAPPSVLNVNVPTRPIDETVGLRWADLDRFGHIRVAAVNRTGRGLAFDVRGAESGLDERCHTALCLRGTVTLTMLSSLEALAAPGADPNDVVRLGRAS